VKPYMYIILVLLVGGGIGYFIGRQVNSMEKSSKESAVASATQEDNIKEIIERQAEAYRLHDALLLYRDCADSYVEVNSNSGESYSLTHAIMAHHDEFRLGKSVNLNFTNLEIKLAANSAVVKGNYSKTSEIYEQEGYKGIVGQGVWILSRANDRWRINAFTWREEVKQ